MRKLLLWGLVVGLLCVPGAFANPDPALTDVISGPDLWLWWLDVSLPLTSVISIDVGGDWTIGTEGVDWTASGPSGWSFTGNNSLLKWVADGADGSSEGSFGAFVAIPKGAVNTNGEYNIEDAAAPIPPFSGNVNGPVVPVPEASTLALLAVGLFAGALIKRRK